MFNAMIPPADPDGESPKRVSISASRFTNTKP